MDGTNIAFTGGTGILSFMDFVAAIARHNLGIGEPLKFGENFKFILYASFSNRGDSLGLQLCEALDQFCKDKGIKNFMFVARLRLENINKERWNDAFIEKAIKSMKSQKIWVCGPPAMSEIFERFLYKLNEPALQFEIL